MRTQMALETVEERRGEKRLDTLLSYVVLYISIITCLPLCFVTRSGQRCISSPQSLRRVHAVIARLKAGPPDANLGYLI